MAMCLKNKMPLFFGTWLKNFLMIWKVFQQFAKHAELLVVWWTLHFINLINKLITHNFNDNPYVSIIILLNFYWINA